MGKERIEMKRTLVVLVSGKAGVGKSTFAHGLADYLSKRYDKLKVGTFPFAQRLKHLAGQMGWNGEKNESGRALLQGLGQVGRAYDPDIWVRATINGYIENSRDYPLDVVFVDDWRFPNEVEFIKRSPLYEIVKVRILCPEREILAGTKLALEISENALPEKDHTYYDYIISNNGTLDVFLEQAKAFWEYILQTHKENIQWI